MEFTILEALNPSQYVFPGYTLSENLLLEAAHDETGNDINPNLILAANNLCLKCQKVMSEVEAQYNQSPSSVRLSPDNEAIPGLHKILSDTKFADPDPTWADLEKRLLANVPFYSSENEMRRSVESGCSLCARILLEPGHRRHPASSFKDSPGFISFTAHSYRDCWHTTNIYVEQAFKNDKIGCYLCLEYHKNEELEAGEDSPIDLSASNASVSTFKLASSWLEKCQKEHKQCRSIRRRTNQSPKRLLDVGTIDASQIRIVYLQDKSPYLTVSHCWGTGPKGLVLEENNAGEIQIEYNDHELPQLVRDCVKAVRGLGHQYLWMDTMCIIQNNPEDKDEEIRKMGDIYAGAVCNIAAVSAKGAHSSLFTKYLPACTTELKFQSTKHNKKGVFVLEESHISLKTPLYDRGWVVQERILSPSCIEYTHLGIRFHCSEMRHGKQLPDLGVDLSKNWSRLLTWSRVGMSLIDRLEGESAWMQIVNRYSCSRFTFEEDRSVGLLGVISVLQECTGLSFSQGVCLDFFPFCLLSTVSVFGLFYTYPSCPVPSWTSTFRSGLISSSPLGIDDTMELTCSDHSIDHQGLVLSLTARCFSSVVLKNHAFLDPKAPDMRLDLSMVLQYNLSPVEVDLALLIRTQDMIHGLILIKVPGETGMWNRLGYFWGPMHSSNNNMEFFEDMRKYQIK